MQTGLRDAEVLRDLAQRRLQVMRETRTHLVVVDGPGGRGLLTLTDLLHRLLPTEAV